MYPMYLSDKYKVETEGNGARVLATRLCDDATLFLQDESAVHFLEGGQPWVSTEICDWHISQYDEVFLPPAQQAKIDAMMLEYCPDEMSDEQKANWARHQRSE